MIHVRDYLRSGSKITEESALSPDHETWLGKLVINLVLYRFENPLSLDTIKLTIFVPKYIIGLKSPLHLENQIENNLL